MFNMLFDDISANLEYLPLGSSQSYWIHVIVWNTASIIIGALSQLCLDYIMGYQ